VALTTVLANDRVLKVELDVDRVANLVARAPRVSYFWLRNYMIRALGDHRRAWFRAKGVKFGRAGGIEVYGVNDGPDPESRGPLDVTYTVTPTDKKRAQTPEEARALLQLLGAEASTGNIVLPVHEFGEDLRTAKWMAIPVRTRPGSPKRWRESTGKDLVFRPSKKQAGTALLYEVERKFRRPKRQKAGAGGRTRRRKGPALQGPPPTVVVEKLRLRFLLTRFVDMKPTLKMYDTWESLESERASQWEDTANRILEDWARGVDS
jgi:hypothetical protein